MGPTTVAAAATICLVALLTTPSHGDPVQGMHNLGRRSAGAITLLERSSCNGSKSTSPIAVNTTEHLSQLRELMRAQKIAAYIITNGDQHQSEYIAMYDMRRKYVSGFSGSNGDAVITLEKAALWTDSRYYVQADEQMDCNWLLMKSGTSGVPSIQEWLAEQLNSGDTVSGDPKIITYTQWTLWSTALEKYGINMIFHEENLVDQIWGEAQGRPPYPSTPVFVLSLQFAGVSWQDKLTAVRKVLREKEADVILITALDEVAYALNLRGGDIPYTPVFRAYLLVDLTSATLYLPEDKITNTVKEHLMSNSTDKMKSVRVKKYEDIWSDLPKVGKSVKKVLLPSPMSYAGGASYYIYTLLSPEKVEFLVSPVLLMKDIKNSVEVQGMQNAHIRDAIAVCQMLRILEEGVYAGEKWDEIKVASTLQDLRMKQQYNNGPSFKTIAAFGSNAALPHYTSTPETNKKIDTSNVFMLDSGGQYFDGTTDITRTIHLGNPTQLQRTVYTSLLMGCINLVSAYFPQGQTLGSMEILIRSPLFHQALNYGHGSTHGIGSFLCVHEAFNTTYNINFFGSQEPGYYKDNDFGIRLENIVTVVPTNKSFEDNPFLTFEPVTLVPYHQKLIDISLMSDSQIQWLNDYHKKVRQLVGDEMKKQGLTNDYTWLLKQTKPIIKEPCSSLHN